MQRMVPEVVEVVRNVRCLVIYYVDILRFILSDLQSDSQNSPESFASMSEMISVGSP